LAKFTSLGEPRWSVFLGGGAQDHASAVAVDEAAGAVYVGGTKYSGDSDGFLAKLTTDGVHQWTIPLGGADRDDVRALAILPGGDVVVAGHTSGATTWVSGGYSTAYRRHGRSYLARLTAAGEHVWSTHLGQSDSMLFGYEEAANGIAVDSQGNIVVVGLTASLDVARDGAVTTPQGGDDAFVVKVSGAGALLWSSYLGGAGRDGALAVGVDTLDRVYVGGHTASAGWVTGPGRTTLAGTDDGFLVRLSPQGQIDWSRYLGGAGSGPGERAVALAVWQEHLVVAGRTFSDEWISGGFEGILTGVADSFLGRVTSTGASNG
jgi:hypothetical protein